MSVLVYTENWDGRFKKLSNELVSYGSKLAEMLNTSTTVLSIGKVDEAELKSLGKYGADKIITVTDEKLATLDNRAYTAVIAQVVEKEKSGIVLLSNNNTGKAIAPRLSVKLKAGIASGITAVPEKTSPFTAAKKVFSGKAFAKFVIKTDIKILTLAQNSYEIVEKTGQAAIESFSPSVSNDLIRTKVINVEKQTGKVLLTDAEIVVSGGRGMKSPDNWGKIEELADLLGGATACSRPVSDEGWRPHEEHTGQTGKIIAPNLYIAFGISGAIQHLAGVSSSKFIVAVNTDKDAPIFEAADYGIVGDALQVLPKFVDAVKELKSL
ncbi:MAG: electron transfer flavoprotein subunit alpha/FixB family protein [Bacteroidales bacterium]|nr:electron transfer flavoprotein subunit alpha/FixB family protein [Bacteroidales bacterium]